MNKSELSLPLSIIVSGLIIAGAIIFTNSNNQVVKRAEEVGNPKVAEASIDEIREVKKSDHIRGSIDAPIKIVEYSDPECPFCARVHATIKTVLSEYGDDVAWVYRQFPLTNLEQGFHVNAIRASNASECVADLAGEEAFWNFTDGIFESNKALSDSLYIELASRDGVDSTELIECIDSGKHQDRINADVENAFAIGGGGTPWTVIIGPDGQKVPISGAQPISVFRAVIDEMLNA